jgi:hypothetical protein
MKNGSDFDSYNSDPIQNFVLYFTSITKIYLLQYDKKRGPISSDIFFNYFYISQNGFYCIHVPLWPLDGSKEEKKLVVLCHEGKSKPLSA